MQFHIFYYTDGHRGIDSMANCQYEVVNIKINMLYFSWRHETTGNDNSRLIASELYNNMENSR